MKEPGQVTILRIGIIGLGEIAQVSHILNLNNLSDYFTITYLCHASKQAIEHCSKKVAGGAPKLTSNAEELIASPDVDVVLVCCVNAFHASYAILALQQNKYVLVEKPLALNYRDIDAIIEAEKHSRGKVFVGYQRRYAEAFLDAVDEVATLEKIEYIRVKDIIGPNSSFVGQSGTYPKTFTDFESEAAAKMVSMEEEMVKEALVRDYGLTTIPDSMSMFRILTGLGVHDLSSLRELVGMPTAVLGASLQWPIWNVLLQYKDFPVSYESGIINVPSFDANIEIYAKNKIVRVNYDTPYVKGLPVTMTIRERIDGSKGDAFQERIIRKTYEDPFTLQFLEFHRCATEGRTPKTSALDARQDLDLIGMMMRKGFSAKS
ncbi:hypothetical protein VTL71DRAFT_2873 [Oculimacula yallundae]|uniref:Gfo/Idh/MocA-like oxidoreductase N-terminal domain-containing protein n=1 Tax=Oculimacula yallundae TaxID=86028 RepID=A0ABR4C5K9_9HELO